MEQLTLSNIQNKDVKYEIRQGVKFSLEFAWMEYSDADPPVLVARDISDMTFLSQLRTNRVDDAGTVVIDFATTPDIDGNVLVIDIPTADMTFTFDEVSTAALTPDTVYYFECKMLNADDEAVDSFQATILCKKDIARVVV